VNSLSKVQAQEFAGKQAKR